MKTILIVEDEPSYQNLLHKELIAKGYTVIDAKDGKEGYESAITVKPDLIVLDIIMREMDGLTMLEQLRANKDGKKIKVIILTNIELDSRIMERALSLNPLHYLVKSDITLTSLIAMIDDELMDWEVNEPVVDEEHKGIL